MLTDLLGRVESAELHGALCIWPGGILFTGADLASAWHRHLTASLLFSLAGQFRVRIGRQAAWRSTRGSSSGSRPACWTGRTRATIPGCWRRPRPRSPAATAARAPGRISAGSRSPDDISTTNVPGLLTLSGNDTLANVALPFTVTIDGVAYTTLTLSTNGWLEIGGDTSGGSDPSNVALPTASHANPFVAMYWDDMQTQGTSIRYGTVGTSPNRTFLADYAMDTVALGSNDAVLLQVQIHESSNVIDVKYREVDGNVDGQAATIGYQSAGGSAATAYPLTFNGKILDDNQPVTGWSVAPLPACGNGIVEGTEQCDEAAANGTGTSCCTATCTLKASGATCRTSGADCFVANTCSGTSGACPNTPRGNGSACTDEPNACTTDLCNGGGTAFVGFTASTGGQNENHFINSWTYTSGSVQTINYPTFASTAGLSLVGNAVQFGTQLRLTPNTNSQRGAAWFTTAQGVQGGFDTTFTFQITNAGADGFAFVVQNSGTSAIGLDGGNLGYGGIPNALAVEFDAFNGGTEFATPHVSVQVPGDANDYASLGHVTYAAMTNGAAHQVRITYAAGTLSVYLDGAASPNLSVAVDLATIGLAGSATCVHAPGNAGAVCRPLAGTCDVAETCTGTSATCPADAFLSSTTVCRGAAGECDLAESCPGNGASCPADAKKPAGSGCTDDGNACTTDQCDGSTDACQHTAGNPGALCRGAAGPCDVAEVCTGASAACPADAFLPATTVCRAAAGVCDVTEFCTGAAAACPPDGKSTSVCRPAVTNCDVAESCDGVGNACPPDGFEPATTVCRASGGVCDPAEHCSGSDAICPADAKSTAVCRPSGGPCDVAESCDGVADTCPSDAFAPSTTVCRAGAGVCDVAESCTGSGAGCPTDAKSTAECRATAGPCDVAESCDGVGDDCPADGFEPSATECRASAGPCDPAESCTGTAATCPADAKSTDVCRPAAGPCDVAENCDGANDACPADAKVPATTTCRPTAGDCDEPESCEGTSNACPADSFTPSGVECRAVAGPCDVAESCTGSGPDCPSDGFTSSSGAFVCRPSAGTCDPSETCDGSGAGCPPDAKSTAVCRPAAGPCDVPDSCDGVGNDCPADAKSTALCRPAADVCDNAESCDGMNDVCPPHAFQPDGTSCDDGNACTATDSCQGGVCTGMPDANVCADHFLCYKVKLATAFTAPPPLHLVDDIQDAHFNVTKARDLCTPTDAGGGRLDADTHLRSYAIKAVTGTARFQKRGNIAVTNELGPLSVDALKPDVLVVPTAKSVTDPSPTLGPNSVDHYKCYKLRVTPGTPRFPKGKQLTLQDQFRLTAPAVFDVKKPRHLCSPVDADGSGRPNPDAHLLCYLTKPAKGQPKHVPQAPVYTQNQFGSAILATVRENEVCVPSLVTLPP